MYLYEWGFQWSKRQMSYKESLEAFRKQRLMPGQSELNAPVNVGESVSKYTYDNESIYKYTDRYIDLRTPHDEKRGLITIFGGGIGVILIYMFVGLLMIAYDFSTKGHARNGEAVGAYDFAMLGLAALIPVAASYFYFKYCFRYLRLEALTARRLIVRFNRVTRKVYLLRPKHLGGIQILDWDKTQIILDKNMSELEGTGGFLILGWDKGDGVDLEGKPVDDMELTFVGKRTRNASELLAFWEYIRRYMEEGPDAAPAPKNLINKFPWPWLSLKVAWRLDTQFLRDSTLWIFVALNILMLPAILIHATGHWLSLLLCYEPKFPRAIEEAGAPKKRAGPR